MNGETSEHRSEIVPPGQGNVRLVLWRLWIAFGLGSLLCWVLPSEKPNAIFGRLSFWQSGLAAALTSVFVCLWLILLVPVERRRVRSFRIVAIWLGVLSVLIVVESCAFLLPAGGPADNPFYVFQEGGIVAGNDKLQFVRPPYLKWKGTSRGDLAMLADVHDPYATTVSFETDFEGFRNERDIRVADVVFLGDSFTEAGNVPAEETFVWRSSSELNVRARNLGRAAYGPTAELIVLKTYGVSCQPRLVVWQFCESNDLNEDVEFRRWVDAGRPQLQPVVDSTRAAIWRRRSPAYLLFQRLKEPRPWPLRGLFRDSHGENHPLLFLKLPDRSNSPAGHIGWPLMAETLQEGVELLRRNEVELLVLFIPQKIRVMGPYVEFNATIRDRMSQNWDLPPEQTLAKYLRDLCLRIHVSFVDATPRLKDAAAAGQLVYLPMDTHLSPQGHAIVSSLITESIRERFENHEPAQRD